MKRRYGFNLTLGLALPSAKRGLLADQDLTHADGHYSVFLKLAVLKVG
jgi:hypothetical protein